MVVIFSLKSRTMVVIARDIVERKFGKELISNYTVEVDKDNRYPVDAVIQMESGAVFMFAIKGEQKALNAVISVYRFEKWEIEFDPIAIFENQQKISPSTIAKVSDAFNKLVPSMEGYDRLEKYLSTKYPRL
ncbi:MAG: hypothetical protein ACTSUE_13780 [Promethearchaeota archaeon]